MPTQDRRAAARRRAWGRGPIILKFEPLEGRQLLAAAAQALPDLVASSFTSVHNADWGDSFVTSGTILNQGSRTSPSGFHVAIYASTSPHISRNSIKLGEVSIPAGLAPGKSSAFETNVTLPRSPIPRFGDSPTGAVYIGLWVDPQRIVRESNKHNNEDLGAPFDTSPVQITADLPAVLVGTSLSITPKTAQWGDTVQLYTQIRNGAQGNAAATTARVVLTPAGSAFGTGNDVTIGTFPVPAIAAWQSVNLVQSITLPTLPPTPLGSNSQFTLTVLPDASFVTNTIYPGYGPVGAGLDQTPIEIDANPNSTATRGPLPDLASTTVTVPTTPLAWGQDFQVSTKVENIGQGNAGPYNLAYVLVGAAGSLANGIVLADVPVGGIEAGGSKTLTQNLTLPVRVPSGLVLDGLGVGRIAVVIDQENAIDEVTNNDNVAVSGPVTLRLLGTDGGSTVPNAPAVSFTQTVSQTPKPAKSPRTHRVVTPRPGAKIHRRPTSTPFSFSSIEHNLSVFPKRVGDLVKNIFK